MKVLFGCPRHLSLLGASDWKSAVGNRDLPHFLNKTGDTYGDTLFRNYVQSSAGWCDA
jgi:hypothetical protein